MEEVVEDAESVARVPAGPPLALLEVVEFIDHGDRREQVHAVHRDGAEGMESMGKKKPRLLDAFSIQDLVELAEASGAMSPSAWHR
ncbi:hypothetical protein [Streptomyces malaysiensis]|uniref:Uncharacterized protein n=1 Tax=Streptomyces malaysiensis subsp. samsunensis TaxID=459658 RepID=A0A9X2RZQ2_STRMQ|nr:hypothetical protein [Streptomyces samsunensis]MCQ8836637.1 hypothetical protein [Streptomyces samsunensis]